MKHFRFLTKEPVRAQSGLSALLEALSLLLDTVYSAVLSAPWKIFFPPGSGES